MDTPGRDITCIPTFWHLCDTAVRLANNLSSLTFPKHRVVLFLNARLWLLKPFLFPYNYSIHPWILTQKTTQTCKQLCMIAFLYTFFQIIKGITNLYNDLRGKNFGQNNIKVLQLSRFNTFFDNQIHRHNTDNTIMTPSQSPDLNPTEALRGTLDSNIRQRYASLPFTRASSSLISLMNLNYLRCNTSVLSGSDDRYHHTLKPVIGNVLPLDWQFCGISQNSKKPYFAKLQWKHFL